MPEQMHLFPLSPLSSHTQPGQLRQRGGVIIAVEKGVLAWIAVANSYRSDTAWVKGIGEPRACVHQDRCRSSGAQGVLRADPSLPSLSPAPPIRNLGSGDNSWRINRSRKLCAGVDRSRKYPETDPFSSWRRSVWISCIKNLVTHVLRSRNSWVILGPVC